MANKVSSFYKDAAGAVDVGLRKYMLGVFSYMSAGLALTATVAYLVSHSQRLMFFFFSNPIIFYGIALIPLGIAFFLASRLASMSVETAKILFFVYAGCLGISLASIFVVYAGSSIAEAFFVAASMFLSMVIYGYTTEKDLTTWGSFLFMGLIGLIISGIVNLFLYNSTFALVISGIGVFVFVGLTAYDTQRIKSYYLDSDTSEISEKKAILGALNLYLDFINCFLYILRLLGSKRN